MRFDPEVWYSSESHVLSNIPGSFHCNSHCRQSLSELLHETDGKRWGDVTNGQNIKYNKTTKSNKLGNDDEK